MATVLIGAASLLAVITIDPAAKEKGSHRPAVMRLLSLWHGEDEKGKTVTYLAGTGVAEDNGINTSCSFQPKAHRGVSAFYNRSLRQYDNTTGFSLTYIVRAAKPLVAK